MVSSNIDLNATLWDDKRLVRLQIGSKTHHVSLKRAYALAHSLLKSKENEAATRILDAIAIAGRYASRTALMRARCKVGMKDYDACKTLLQKLIPEDKSHIVDQLQAAFVYDALGMRLDAARELVGVVNERTDLPSLCLLMGDLFASLGKTHKAILCWQLAMKRDTNGGLVANAAKEELVKLVSTLKKKPDTSDEKPAA
jgi:predicted negative regulator of RcsB-dependent stress response